MRKITEKKLQLDQRGIVKEGMRVTKRERERNECFVYKLISLNAPVGPGIMRKWVV